MIKFKNMRLNELMDKKGYIKFDDLIKNMKIYWYFVCNNNVENKLNIVKVLSNFITRY